MQWSAAPQAGFSAAAETYLPVVDDPGFSYRRVNVEQAMADPESLYHRLRRLIARRRASPALRRGRLELLSEEAPELLAFRRVAETEAVVAVYNFSERAVRSGVAGEEIEPYGYRWSGAR